jgi:hypothetical protein
LLGDDFLDPLLNTFHRSVPSQGSNVKQNAAF